MYRYIFYKITSKSTKWVGFCTFSDEIGVFYQKAGNTGKLPLPGATLRVRKHALNSRGAYFQTRRVLTF